MITLPEGIFGIIIGAGIVAIVCDILLGISLLLAQKKEKKLKAKVASLEVSQDVKTKTTSRLLQERDLSRAKLVFIHEICEMEIEEDEVTAMREVLRRNKNGAGD
jgi:nucleoside-triphosphatase THEP1